MKIYIPSSTNVIAPARSVNLYLSSYIQGVSGAVLPIQYTKDGVLVVFSDRNLKNWSGNDINIEEITYKDISRENVAISFSTKYPFAKGCLSQVKSLEYILNYIPNSYELIFDLLYRAE